MITSLKDIITTAQKKGPCPVAIAAAAELETLTAARAAQDMGIATCNLTGNQNAIERVAAEQDISLTDMDIIHTDTDEEAARQAMLLAGQEKVVTVVKGFLKTAILMRAALSKDAGLRGNALLSHVAVFEVPGFDRLIYLTDGGVIITPTLEQKVTMIEYAMTVARKLGVEKPRVAILTAANEASLDMPRTLEATSLAAVLRTQGLGDQIAGPITLDCAISTKAATLHEYDSSIAGRADILLVPHLEAGNILGKTITQIARGAMAGLVMGAKVPISLGSRADPHEWRLAGIALGVLVGT